MLREVLEQLATTVRSFALVADPVHLESNLIAGVVKLPLQVTVTGNQPAAVP